MSFSAGTYTLPGPALVTGDTVSATENNQFRNDVATAFNLTFLRNGTSTATANLPMGGYKLTGLGVATTSGDALSYGQAAVITDLTAAGTVTISSGTVNGVAYLNGSKVLTTGSALTFDGTNLGVVGNLSLQSANGTVNFKNAVGTTIQQILYDDADGSLTVGGGAGSFPVKFRIGSSEQMRLTSTGLGIGTSSPSQKLHVSGTGSTPAIFERTGSNGIFIQLKDASGVSSYIGSTNGVFSIQTSGSGYSDKLIIDSSGNLGLGVTPSAWGGGYKGVDIAGGGAINTANSLLNIGANAYFNGTNWIYSSTDYASRIRQYQGAFAWFTAPSGTAGNAISFTQAMTLDASGNLGIGTSSPTAKLHLSGASGNTYTYVTTSTVEGAVGEFAVAGIFNVGSTSNHPLGFRTNNTERMRIDSSGNVGIGTSSPGAKLDVNSATSADIIALRYSTLGKVAGVYLDSSTAYYGAGANNYTNAFAAGHSTNYVAMQTAGSERMRIDSSGNLLVGTTASGLQNNNSQQLNTSAGYGVMNHVSGTANGTAYFYFGFNGSGIGTITQATNSTVAYNTSSDYRLKENIQPMQNALGVVAQLNPVTYNWKADGSDGQGFIAHELQAVVPDCVTGEKDAVDAEGKPVYQGIDTSFLVATLCKAIQEQQEQINQLKAEVAALKGN